MAAALWASAVPIALAVLSVTLFVLAVSMAATDRYRATASILGATSTAPDAGADADPRRLTTNLTLLSTPAVRDAAARKIPGETASSVADKISAQVEPDANVIKITATANSAADAAAIANAVAQAFLDQRAAQARARIASTSATLTARLAQLGATPGTAEESAAIRRRLSDLVVEQANAGSDLQLNAPAQPPSSPFAPHPFSNAVVAFFAALTLAVLAVLARERLRPAVGGPGELRRVVGLPVIARLAVPDRGAGDRLERPLRALSDRAPPALGRPLAKAADRWARSRSARRERARTATDKALRSLLGAVLVALPPGPRRVVVVTSPAPDQGSTRAAAELARALAQAGQRTLAISTDLTAPRLARALGVPAGPGLCRALDQMATGDAVQLRAGRVLGLDALHVIPDDGSLRGGIGLLRPGAVETLFEALEDSAYAYVVVDAPGLIGGPEAWLVARHADAVVLACPERASAGELADARGALDSLGVPVLGAVIVGAGGDYEPVASNGAPAGVQAAVLAPSRRAERDDDGPAADAETTEPVAEIDGAVADGDVRRLLDKLRASDRPLTVAELCGALGGAPATRVRAHLRVLLTRGDIVRGGGGGRVDPYVYRARRD